MILNPPSYKLPPFGNCEALGWRLGIPSRDLLALAERASDLYYLADEIPKSDGSTRKVYAAREPLRTVQKKILDRILRHAYFPGYLMGGIKDSENPRDYVRNAAKHAGAGTLIQEDVSSFFPSTTQALVTRTFRGLFRFPDDVASCLSNLCTRHNELVQGASTSTYLANLILWDREPALEAQLRRDGLRYSRYIDDINVSCRRALPAHHRTAIVHAIYSMLRAYSYQPKRAKQVIASTGQQMTLHGLNVDRSNPKLTRADKKRIRSAVYELEQHAHSEPANPDTWTDVARVRSRLVIWRRLDAAQAEELWQRVNRVLHSIKPLHMTRIHR